MKGFLSAIVAATILARAIVAGAPIQTNSFVRHDIAFSSTPLDFAVGEWKSTGESMIAVVATDQLEIAAIDFASEGSTNLVQYSADRVTGPIVIGDVDGDGGKDIVFGAGTNVFVRLNTSSTTAPAFDSSATLAIGGSGIPHGLALADLDGDGKLDIIYASSSIYALRNQSTAGAISFASPIIIYTNAASFQIGDLDGDGLPELDVATIPPGSFNFRLQNKSSPGNISFTQQLTLNGGPTLLEMNGDSKPDYVAITRFAFPRPDQPATTLTISINSSQPGVISFSRGATVGLDVPELDGFSRVRATLPSFRPALAAADFNLDGEIDLVDAYLTNRLVVIENLNWSQQSFTTWGKGVEVGTPLYPYEPTIADVNHDGKPDIVLGAGFSKYISIFENKITPTPEIAVLIDPVQSTIDLGATIHLSAAIYGANVTALDYMDGNQIVASGAAANGFAAQYQPASVGLHTITAHATLGTDSGFLSKPVGLRVIDPNVGNLVTLGDGIVSAATFLIFDSGRAFGVGSNARGQLGDPFYDDHTGFVEIPQQPNAGGWKQIGSGAAFSIGLTTSNRVFSWGANDLGQLGRPVGIVTNPVPGEIDFGAATITKIAAGNDFGFALDANGEFYAWGANEYGQLGKGDTALRTRPTKIRRPDGVARWSDFSVGHRHVLALDDAGRLFGWGWNFWGQVGQPRTNTAILSPTLIDLPAGETSWTNINAGVVASYAQTASGRTYRWGNYLTDAGAVFDPTPTELVAPEGSGGFKLIGAGSPLGAALGNDSNIYVWSAGFVVPAGLGDRNTVTNPTRLPLPAGVNRWTSLTVAAQRAAAIADDGRVFAWGTDFHYALGTGATDALVPTAICLPFQSCATNQPPFVKLIHPAFGDVFPANGILRFEVATADDDVVSTVRIFENKPSFGGPISAEIARLSFGETYADLLAPKSASTSLYVAAYDQSGLGRTSGPVILNFPNISMLTTTINLDSSAPTNEITGWQENYANLFNSSSFRLASVSAVVSNLPPETTIRGGAVNPADNTVTLVDPFGVGPRESIGFRIEYKLPDGVTNAQVRVYFVPGDPIATVPITGDIQPLTMTILTNGLRLLEVDGPTADNYVVQFTDTLTTWFNAGGFFEAAGDKLRWLDGGPPATSKHPAATGCRFYRVLRKP